jgi:hypothetical protein
MTPDSDNPQDGISEAEGIPEWSEGPCGGGVLFNGVDPNAARRAHMREQTMAKQAAERRSVKPASGMHLDHQTRLAMAQERAAALHAELASLSDEHQDWLRTQGFVEAGLPGKRRKSLPPDTVTADSGRGDT